MGGYFKKNLQCIQLQIQTLLEDVGGEPAGELLDILSGLDDSERKVYLKVFLRAIQRLTENGVRAASLDDSMLKDFEDCLYQNLVDGVNAIAEHPEPPSVRNRRKFEVISKKTTPEKSNKMVCIEKAREKLKSNSLRPQEH